MIKVTVRPYNYCMHCQNMLYCMYCVLKGYDKNTSTTNRFLTVTQTVFKGSNFVCLYSLFIICYRYRKNIFPKSKFSSFESFWQPLKCFHTRWNSSTPADIFSHLQKPEARLDFAGIKKNNRCEKIKGLSHHGYLKSSSQARVDRRAINPYMRVDRVNIQWNYPIKFWKKM